MSVEDLEVIERLRSLQNHRIVGKSNRLRKIRSRLQVYLQKKLLRKEQRNEQIMKTMKWKVVMIRMPELSMKKDQRKSRILLLLLRRVDLNDKQLRSLRKDSRVAIRRLKRRVHKPRNKSRNP